MKTLLKLLLSSLVTKERLKKGIRRANAKLAEKTIDEAKAKAIGVGEDAANTLALYMKGYANDGKIDDAERAEIDANDDALVDKYWKQDAVDAFIDGLFE